MLQTTKKWVVTLNFEAHQIKIKNPAKFARKLSPGIDLFVAFYRIRSNSEPQSMIRSQLSPGDPSRFRTSKVEPVQLPVRRWESSGRSFRIVQITFPIVKLEFARKPFEVADLMGDQRWQYFPFVFSLADLSPSLSY